jgi:hypothetical protein
MRSVDGFPVVAAVNSAGSVSGPPDCAMWPPEVEEAGEGRTAPPCGIPRAYIVNCRGWRRRTNWTQGMYQPTMGRARCRGGEASARPTAVDPSLAGVREDGGGGQAGRRGRRVVCCEGCRGCVLRQQAGGWKWGGGGGRGGVPTVASDSE